MAREPPRQNSPRETAHTIEKWLPRPVISKTACASPISRRKIPGFFLPDDSLSLSRIPFFGRSRNANRLSVNSTGFKCRSRNAPTINPAQDSNCMAVMIFQPPFLQAWSAGVPTYPAASRFPSVSLQGFPK